MYTGRERRTAARAFDRLRVRAVQARLTLMSALRAVEASRTLDAAEVKAMVRAQQQLDALTLIDLFGLTRGTSRS